MKLTVLLTISLLLSSCNYNILNVDTVCATILKVSKTRRNHLKNIQYMSDSVRISYVDSVLKEDEKSFYEVKGVIKSKKDWFYTLPLTSQEIENYLK